MRKTLLIMFLCLPCYFAFAQSQITVKGTVTDQTNQPVPGATVLEKGTKNAVIASNEGTYQIKVSPTATLVFSFLGAKAIEEKVNNRLTIDVKLVEDANNLNEVVVMGYGAAVAKKDLTGAVSSVKGSELAKVPVQNVAQALQGRIAGMQVTMPSGDPEAQPTIKIRGGTSITQSNEPLYVVDGVPQTDGLNFLDPTDIESIDVLKDASATSIYGARGGNGVVLVTTKTIKPGKTTINYEGYIGARKITRFLPVLSPLEYYQYAYENNSRAANFLTAFTNVYGLYTDAEATYGNRPGVNWQKEVLGDAVMNQYHKISASGGSNDVKYSLFYARNVSDGILLNSGSNKDIAKLTVSNNIGKKAVITGVVNFSNQLVTGTGGTNNGGNARLSFLQTLLQYRPVIAKDGDDFDLMNDVLDPFDNPNNPAFQNPIIALNTRFVENNRQDLNSYLSARYNIAKHFTYNGLIGYTLSNRTDKRFIDSQNIQAIRGGGPSGSSGSTATRRLNYNNVLTYANTFNKIHKMDISLGQEYIYNYFERLSASASNFPVSNNGWFDLGAGTVAGFPSTNAEDDKLFSLFARANYTFKGKYLFSASLRRDGSSKFGDDNKFAYFPSAAVAWRIIDEQFMKQQKVFSELKLRASYGTSGNNRVANYLDLQTFQSGNYPLNDVLNASVFANQLANPGLKWETVVQSNVGLDLGFFKQRITLVAEFYDNRSKDLLYNTRIPASTGYIRQLQNIGQTSSRGIELSLNTENIRTSKFNWQSNFNIAFNRTKVLKLNGEENQLLVSSYNSAVDDYILQVGSPVGLIYGYQSDGVYQVDDFNYDSTAGYTLKNGVVNNGNVVAPGFAKYKDISGPNGVPDGIINDLDRTVIGNANPKFTGGLNNTFSYKGIDLSILVDFTYGNDIYNATVQNNLTATNDFNSNLGFQANRWTNIDASGQLITDPATLAALNQGKVIASVRGYTLNRVNSQAIEDGSFLRLNNINIGYTLPKSWVKRVKLSKARIYFTAYNLAVLTKYSGYDPEVSVINNPLTPGVDFSAYPRAKSFVAGLNLSF